jgi:hypothetical protein
MMVEDSTTIVITGNRKTYQHSQPEPFDWLVPQKEIAPPD